MADRRAERRLGWALVAPALSVPLLVALVPLGWAFWESLHRHDLRMPWLGRPFVGLDNYAAIASDPRFWAALGHTLFFAAASVALELALGLVLALAMDGTTRGRGPVRAALLVPWALPTVVAALLWRFLFDSGGLVNAALAGAGLLDRPLAWFAGPAAAWVPLRRIAEGLTGALKG